ncbi:MAG: trypsin-like serine protease [Pseudobdellovibrio sp.]
METRTVLRLTLSLTLLAFLAACAPATNSTPTTYQSSEAAQSEIIGGMNVDLKFAQQNGVVGIFDAESGGLCTGSLIAANLVITAGHCVNVSHPTAMLVFFTPNFQEAIIRDQTGNFKYNPKLVRAGLKVIRHEKYGDASIKETDAQHDVALIRLESAAPAEFSLAQLAPSQLTTSLHAGSLVTLAGYGVSTYKADPKSGRPLASTGSGLLRKVDKIQVLTVRPNGEEIMFDQSQGRGACHGDSGGPAYFTDAVSKKTFVIGVTSRDASPNRSCDSKTIYTGMMGYSDWINANSKQILK